MAETMTHPGTGRGPGMGQGQRRDGRGRRDERQADAEGFRETVVSLNRVTKVVKGGKRFSFSALVVVGDRNGRVGAGLGKAKEVQSTIQKAGRHARREVITIPLIDGTIPHEIIGHFGAGRVWMKPAGKGTGVIAGGGVRAILEAAGIRNILTKSLGSTNPFSMVYATMEALKQLKTKEEVLKIRGRA